MVDPNDIRRFRKQVDRKLVAYQAARTRHREEKKALKQAKDRSVSLREALAVATEVAKQVQEEAHQSIAEVVTFSLRAVFDDPYQFKILFEQKRGRTEARLVFERHGLEVDPLTASGGGVVDVAAFALRLSCLMLSRPSVRRVLVLDEPFKFVSPEYQDRLRDLVQTLAEKMDCQFIIVSHLERFRVGRVIDL